MIYTVTLNPSIDYCMRLNSILRPGKTNRAASEAYYVGGKGINVSTVLKNLGVESCAIGFVGGFTGDAIEREVAARGVSSEFIRISEGISRINLKLKKGGEETELNGAGPHIAQEELRQFFEQMTRLGQGDLVILSGSIPPSIPENTYERILAMTSGNGVLAVVDASGDLLRMTLRYRPFLIKPNREELWLFFHERADEEEDRRRMATSLQELGARNVLLSLDAEGAELYAEDGRVYRTAGARGEVRDSVGAGDSMIAGFLAEYFRSGSYENALRLGNAAGAATAFSDGLADAEGIRRMYQELYGEKAWQ